MLSSHERATAAGAVSVSSTACRLVGAASAPPGTAAMAPAARTGRNKVLRIKKVPPPRMTRGLQRAGPRRLALRSEPDRAAHARAAQAAVAARVLVQVLLVVGLGVV